MYRRTGYRGNKTTRTTRTTRKSRPSYGAPKRSTTPYRTKRRAKKSKARTRFDHLPDHLRGYGAGKGGLSFSNETSQDNPLYCHNHQMMEYYKKKNESLVAQNPFSRRYGKGRRNINRSNISNLGQGLRPNGPKNEDFGDQGGGGFKRGRGGVAFVV